MVTNNLISPREYQLEALEVVTANSMKGITRQLICLPTGTGKTVVFALLAKELNRRTLVIAHTEELIEQAVEKFKIVWPGVNVGVVKAESDEINSHVVVASIQTICREKRLERLKQQGFGLMIIDEAHHATAPSYEKVIWELGFIEDNPEKLLVGVTATPKRGDGIGLNAIFQAITFERSISTMIRAGYLSPLVGKQIYTKIDLTSVGFQNGDFMQDELAKVINTVSRNQLIVDNYKLNALERKKALVFCVNVQHAKDLSMAFNLSGISSSPVYGAMEEEGRKKILSDFSDGKYQVLTNCQLLVEGYDEPKIDCIIMGRPTASTTLFTQMIGRGIRTFPTKQDCLVLDFTDNATRHNLCTCLNSLDGAVTALACAEEEIESEERESPSQRKIVDSNGFSAVRVLEEKIENIEFFEKTTFAWIPVGGDWHLKLTGTVDVWVKKSKDGYQVSAQKLSEVISLSNRPLPLNYALGVAEEWIRKQTTKNGWARKDAVWRGEPATPKQIDSMSRLGITFDHGISKGQASQLLDSKINAPATEKQLYWLRKHGLPHQGLSKIEASKVIAQKKAC